MLANKWNHNHDGVLRRRSTFRQDMQTTMNNNQMKPVSLFQKEIPSLSNGSIRTTNQLVNTMSTIKRPLLEVNPFLQENLFQRQDHLHQICNQNLFGLSNAQRTGTGTNSRTDLSSLFEINPFIKATPIQVRQGNVNQSCSQISFGKNNLIELGAGMADSKNNSSLRSLFEINPFKKGDLVQERQNLSHLFNDTSSLQHGIRNNCNQNLFQQNSEERRTAGTDSMNASNVRPLFGAGCSIKESTMQARPEARQDTFPQQSNASLQHQSENSRKLELFWQNSINKFEPETTSSNNSNLIPLLKVATSTRQTQMETESKNLDQSKANISVSTSGTSSNISQNLVPTNVTESSGVEKSLAILISSDSSSSNGKRRLKDNQQDTEPGQKRVKHKHKTGKNARRKLRRKRMRAEKRLRSLSGAAVNVTAAAPVTTLSMAAKLGATDTVTKENGICKKVTKQWMLPCPSTVSKAVAVPVTSSAEAISALGAVDAISEESKNFNCIRAPVKSSVKEETPVTDRRPRKKIKITLKKPVVAAVSSVTTNAPTLTIADMGQKERVVSSKSTGLVVSSTTTAPTLRIADIKEKERLTSSKPTVPTLTKADMERKKRIGIFLNKPIALELPSVTTITSTRQKPTTVDTKPKDRQIDSKSIVSSTKDQHCKVCNKAYKLNHHDNKEGSVISYHLFETYHLENTLALHDPVDFRSKKHNFTIGLENSKHKSRTLSKYRAYLINAVKSIEMRFIRKGQIPPDEVKTVVISKNKAMTDGAYCELCDCDFHAKSLDYQGHTSLGVHLIRTLEKHRPGLARKLYYLTKVNAADWPRTLKQRRFFTAIRAALKMVKADFEKRNIPVPNEIPSKMKDKKNRVLEHDFSESDDLVFQWTQEDPIKDVHKLFSDMHVAFEKLKAARAQNSNLDLPEKSSSQVSPFDGLLNRHELACLLNKDELITAVLERRRKKMPEKVAQSDSLSADTGSSHSSKIQESLPVQVNRNGISQGRKSPVESAPKKNLWSESTDSGIEACSKGEKLRNHTSASVSVKMISTGTQTFANPQQKLNTEEGLLPTPILPSANMQRMDLHKGIGLFPIPAHSIADENYLRQREGSLLPLPTEKVSGNSYLQNAQNNIHYSETYSRNEKLQQKAVERNRKRKRSQDFFELKNSNSVERRYETECTKQKEVFHQETDTQQFVKDKENGTNAAKKIFLAKSKVSDQQESTQHTKEDLGGTFNEELHKMTSRKKEKQVIDTKIESSDESIDDWKEIPLKREKSRRRNRHSDGTSDYGYAEKADERENQMCPDDVNNVQFSSLLDENLDSNSSYQYQVSREDIQPRHYDLSAKREALLTTLNTLKTCLITNEAEADMAWQISFSLTEALLQYRRGQKPNF